MAVFKQTVELPYPLRKTFNDWDKVHFKYTARCYCTSIMTDMEEFIEVEVLEEDCLKELCKAFKELGFQEVDESITRLRKQNAR